MCEVAVDPDGMEFDRACIEVSRIKEDADYEGVRVHFHATLARARIPMQLDIGFGDVITPGPTKIEYPTLLDFPAPYSARTQRRPSLRRNWKRSRHLASSIAE